MKKRAVCRMPVELYDSDLRGYYKAGDVLDGEKAAAVLDRYPMYFAPATPAKEEK
jgi:hypothetical protein